MFTKIIKNKLYDSRKYIFFFVLVFALFPVLPLFAQGLPITHDGQDHVARIANFYKNLEEGNIIPRWAGNLNWGYGHPILEFLYPLPSYIAALFHFIGFSLVDSTKFVFALGMVLSTLFMYLWLSRFTSKLSALLGAVMYTYAPYRFVELYVRGDIGENLAFAFIPLVLLSMHRIYKNKHAIDVVWGSVSLALLILSHNAISLMFIPFIVLYGITLSYLSKEKNKLTVSYVILIISGLSLSAFFWIPGLLEGKYTLRNFVTGGEYLSRFVVFKDFIYGPWNYGGSGQFTVQFGILAWITIILTPYTFIFLKKSKEKLILLLIALTYLIISVFLMLPYSDFIWSRVIYLQNFQFPWRFLAIVVFLSSVLGALLLEAIPEKVRTRIGIMLIILGILASISYISPKGYLLKPESFYAGIYKSTTDTGESAPVWSIRFMEKTASSNLEVVDGKAKVESVERKSTYHRYKVLVQRKTIFRENTIYFPGWEIKANGQPLDVDFHTRGYNGVMKFTLEKGEYVVEALYKETKLRLFADIISFISLGLILIGLLSISFRNSKNKKNEK